MAAEERAARLHGEWLVGYGCASSVRPVKRDAAIVRIALEPDWRASVATAHHEIGNGIYTVLAMQASKRLGLPPEAITVELGDTALPPAGVSGGSSMTTSLLPALANGCEKLRDELARATIAQNDTLAGLRPEQLRLEGGWLVADGGKRVSVSDVMKRLDKSRLETVAVAASAGGGADALEKLRQGRLTLGNPAKDLH